MLSNPPLILLSFLPAPQQAILSVDLKASCIALYGEDGAKSIFNDMQQDAKEETADGSASTIADEESDDEETIEDEDENEYDSEEDEYDSEEDEEWRDISNILEF